MMNATHETVDALRKQLWTLRLAGASMKERAALGRRIEAAEREAGPRLPPPRAPRTCCDKAVVSYKCTCSHMTQCPDHGERHHGTHD